MLGPYSRWVSGLLFGLVLAGAVTSQPQAGQQSAFVVSAYSAGVSSVHYVLDPHDRSRIASISFKLADEPAAGQPLRVLLRLGAAAAPAYACSSSAGSWICRTPDGPTIAAIDQLQISASY